MFFVGCRMGLTLMDSHSHSHGGGLSHGHTYGGGQGHGHGRSYAVSNGRISEQSNGRVSLSGSHSDLTGDNLKPSIYGSLPPASTTSQNLSDTSLNINDHYEEIGDKDSDPLIANKTKRKLDIVPTGNINVRAAFIHVVGDFLQSLGVLVAALIIYFKVSTVTMATALCGDYYH